MSSGCGDVLSLEDLKTAKKHQLFEAEVITGKQGGVAEGADIDYATNQVTGQTQKTLPAVLRDAGFRPAPFTFTTGGTLGVNDADLAVLWPIPDGGDGNYYAWKGALPKIIPAASTPLTAGGIAETAWVPIPDTLEVFNTLAQENGLGFIGNFHSVASMVAAADFQENQRYITLGYYTPGDGGGGEYLIKSGVTPDGFVNHDVGGGLTAVLQLKNGVIDVRQGGAKSQGTAGYNALDDAKDAHDALEWVFGHYRSVRVSGHYLCKGVLRTPPHYGGLGLYADDYRWTLEGFDDATIFFDLTGVPLSERGNGWAVAFGFSNKDYTQPNTWENGSTLVNGVQRNISIRNISFWNRNWTETKQNADTLDLEIGLGLFAAEMVTVENVVTWGFRANCVSSCFASTFTNCRFRNGMYGFNPYAGTTIVGNSIFAGSNKYGITTRTIPGLTSTHPITYGLTLNAPATDASREFAYDLDAVYGCVINVASMEGFLGDGVVVGSTSRDVSINGVVTTPYVGTGRPLKVENGAINVSLNDVYIPTENYGDYALYISSATSTPQVKLNNVRSGNESTLTNLSDVRKKYMRRQRVAFMYTAITPGTNVITIPLDDFMGMNNNFGETASYAYAFHYLRMKLKVNDGTNFFVYDFDLWARRASAPTYAYEMALIRSSSINGVALPAITQSIVLSGSNILITVSPPSGTWNIIGCDISPTGSL